MKLKKNKFITIYIFSILLLIAIFIISIPFANFFKKIKLQDNQYVKDQIFINPNDQSSQIIDEPRWLYMEIGMCIIY